MCFASLASTLSPSGHVNNPRSKIKGNLVRKKKLDVGKAYEFQVRVQSGAPSSWGPFSTASVPLNLISPDDAHGGWGRMEVSHNSH